MNVTAVKALNNYFNTGENKKPLREFAEEIKRLNDAEKTELATLVCNVTGDTLVSK